MNSSIKTRRSTSVAALHVLCELGMSRDATLADWECTDRLALIETPTFVIGAAHDTMDPAHMEMMARQLQNGEYVHCPGGSHLAIYDDQA